MSLCPGAGSLAVLLGRRRTTPLARRLLPGLGIGRGACPITDRASQYREQVPRWSLVVLAVAAVVCAGIGVSLTGAFTPFGAASFGWTAYAPLSKTVYSGSYAPIDTTWLVWAPRLGVALLALGAGTAGVVIAALLLRRRASIKE